MMSSSSFDGGSDEKLPVAKLMSWIGILAAASSVPLAKLVIISIHFEQQNKSFYLPSSSPSLKGFFCSMRYSSELGVESDMYF